MRKLPFCSTAPPSRRSGTGERALAEDRAQHTPPPEGRAPGSQRAGPRAPDHECLALTRQQLADLIDVTYWQAHQYEKGIGRVAIGPLCKIGRSLDVEVSYFYEDCRHKAGSHHRISKGYSWICRNFGKSRPKSSKSDRSSCSDRLLRATGRPGGACKGRRHRAT
jgi:hypothetical protein